MTLRFHTLNNSKFDRPITLPPPLSHPIMTTSPPTSPDPKLTIIQPQSLSLHTKPRNLLDILSQPPPDHIPSSPHCLLHLLTHPVLTTLPTTSSGATTALKGPLMAVQHQLIIKFKSMHYPSYKKNTKQGDSSSPFPHPSNSFLHNPNLDSGVDTLQTKLSFKPSTSLKGTHKEAMEIEPNPNVLHLQLALAEAIQKNEELENEVRNYESLLVAAGEVNETLEARVSELEKRLESGGLEEGNRGRVGRKYSL